MDNDQALWREPEPKTQPSAAAEAFAGLAASVTGMEERMNRRMEVLTRAVEHVAIEKQNIEIPDYSPTLSQMNGVLADMTRRMKAVEDAPALQMTPDTLGERMQAAATRARQEDRATLLEARQKHVDAAQALWMLHGKVATIHDQRRRLLWATGGGLLAGCLLWSFLPGVILRSLPQGWHMPEAMAAHIIGEPTFWEAGTQLMRAGCQRAPNFPQMWALKIPYAGGSDGAVISRIQDRPFPSSVVGRVVLAAAG